MPTPVPGRYQDYEASLTVRVKDVDTLHDRTAEATQLARSFGGYVASVDESTSGGTGQSDLVLRIPVARVEDAYFRLAKLGTVTAQHLSIRDLDQVVRTQRRRIVQLKVSDRTDRRDAEELVAARRRAAPARAAARRREAGARQGHRLEQGDAA